MFASNSQGGPHRGLTLLRADNICLSTPGLETVATKFSKLDCNFALKEALSTSSPDAFEMTSSYAEDTPGKLMYCGESLETSCDDRFSAGPVAAEELATLITLLPSDDVFSFSSVEFSFDPKCVAPAQPRVRVQSRKL